MNTKKSKIASEVLAEVKAFFKQAEYKKSATNITAYCQWAFKTDGPTYYETPTPMDCVVKRGHPHYVVCISIKLLKCIYLMFQKPRGLLRSEIIISVASHFMRHTSGSAIEPNIDAANPPKALYALILLAVRSESVYMLIHAHDVCFPF